MRAGARCPLPRYGPAAVVPGSAVGFAIDQTEDRSQTPVMRRSRSRRTMPPGGATTSSLSAFGCVAIQAVHRSGLGRPKGDPVLHIVLQCDEKLLASLLCLVADILWLIEPDLVGEFAHQWPVFTSRTPQRHVALGHDAFSEIEPTQFQQHFFDNCLVHEADRFGIRFPEGG